MIALSMTNSINILNVLIIEIYIAELLLELPAIKDYVKVIEFIKTGSEIIGFKLISVAMLRAAPIISSFNVILNYSSKIALVEGGSFL